MSTRRHTMARGGPALLLASLVLLAGLGAAAPSGAAQIYCKGVTRHWSIQSGSVPLKIGWVELRVELCNDGRSIVRTASATDSDTTGPGDSTDFDVKVTSPSQTAFNSGDRTHVGYVRYSAQVRVRQCAPFHAGNVCSLTYRAGIWVSARLLIGFVWAPAHNRFLVGVRWVQFHNGAYCYDKLCPRLS